MRSILPALGVWLLVGCGPDFELQSEIRRVRVLAIQTTPAELVVDPDAPTLPGPMTFNALAVTPDARPVTVRYALCRFTSNPYDGRCPGADSVPLSDGTLSLADAEVQAVLLGALAAGAPGGGGTPDPGDPALLAALARGVPLFIGYEATDGSGTPEGTERGVRRVTLRATTTPNQNPVVSDILWDGAPLTGPLPVSREVTFTPVLAEGEGPRSEQVFFSWFATGDGEVKAFRSQEPVEGRPGDPTTAYDTPATPQRVTFWVVARDERGGVGWLSRTVDVGP